MALGLPIMSAEWLHKCWEHRKNRYNNIKIEFWQYFIHVHTRRDFRATEESMASSMAVFLLFDY